MNECDVFFEGGMRFRAQSKGHAIIIDRSAKGGGTDMGPDPPDVLLAALGSCIGIYLAEFAARRELDLSGMRIKVTSERNPETKLMDNFKASIHLPDSIDPSYRETLLRAGHQCLIHKTLESGARCAVELAS